MKKFCFLIAIVLVGTALQAQPQARISWTGTLNCEYCPLDSVVVTNKSNQKKVVFHYPDTVFKYSDVGIATIKQEMETSLKIYPNPFSDKVQVEFSLAYSSETDIVVCDMLGREIIRHRSALEAGTHRFDLSLPAGIYNLNLQMATDKESARVVSEGSKNTIPQLLYTGIVPYKNAPPKQMQKADELFHYGDTLIIQGFISNGDAFQYMETEKHIVAYTEDTLITFVFYKMLMDTNKVIIVDSLIRSKDYIGGRIPCYYPPDIEFYLYYGRFTIINTQIGLDSLFACDSSLVQPTIDFSKQSLILVRGTSPNLILCKKSVYFSFLKNCIGDYVIKMDVRQSDSPAFDEFYWTVIVNEVIQSEEEVKLVIINKYW